MFFPTMKNVTAQQAAGVHQRERHSSPSLTAPTQASSPEAFWVPQSHQERKHVGCWCFELDDDSIDQLTWRPSSANLQLQENNRERR